MTGTEPQPGGTVPITWVRANLGALIRWTARTRERTVITDHGRPAAVLVSAEELAHLQDVLASKRNPVGRQPCQPGPWLGRQPPVLWHTPFGHSRPVPLRPAASWNRRRRSDGGSMEPGWQVEEFGAHHEGRAVAVLADGTEPKPALFDTGSGGHIHQSSEWWCYDGALSTPRATDLRGGCSCGWRGTGLYPLKWAELGEQPYHADTPGPREDWLGHIRQVEARTIPVPDELTELLRLLDEKLTDLAADAPLAALRLVTALERTAARAGTDAAHAISEDDLSWQNVGDALGTSADEAQGRVWHYRDRQ